MIQKSAHRYFFLPLLLLCLTYLGFELFFNQYAMISVDEFWFAHRAYEYKNGIPYRDFAPYKTVIGYYLLLLPMLFSQGLIKTLVFTKNAIAVCNTLVLFISAAWLRKFFAPKAVLYSVALLLCMEIMLTYSTNIRVDLFAYWFCLFSFLFLLSHRYIIAGLLIGIAFATSQKAIWYIVASNVALGLHWALSARNRVYFFNIVRFNATALIIIAAYLIFWATLVDWQTIYNSVFIEASAMYQLDWYNATRSMYWQLILLFNPLTFLLWPLTIISLFVSRKGDKTYQLRRFVIAYTFTIMLCLIPYKQVFPYYMQVTLPAFLVLYASFFTWLREILNAKRIIIMHKNALAIFTGIYTVTTIVIISAMNLPAAYLLICVLATALTCFFYYHHSLSISMHALSKQLVVMSLIFLGMVYPLTIYVARAINLNGSYQRANLAVIDKLLLDGSDYTAGIELIYNKKQPIAGLRHLMGPAIDYLYQPTAELRKVMTASLYEDPTSTIKTVNSALKNSQVKFYVNNYRMNALPNQIKNYLSSQYQHYWGSIYMYAPKIPAGSQKTAIKFPGEYYIQAHTNKPITINGKQFKKGDHIILEKKTMQSKAEDDFRLKYIPRDPKLHFDPAFKADEWERMIF